jgi:hypothetical protein
MNKVIQVRSRQSRKDFSYNPCVQTGSGAHTSPFAMGNGGLLLEYYCYYYYYSNNINSDATIDDLVLLHFCIIMSNKLRDSIVTTCLFHSFKTVQIIILSQIVVAFAL